LNNRTDDILISTGQRKEGKSSYTCGGGVESEVEEMDGSSK